MSKIAKNSIKFSKEINCSFENGILIAKGKLGELSLNLNPLYTLDIREEELFVIPKNNKDKVDPNWGTMRALVANTIKGKGISFMEDVTRWHNTMPNQKQIEQARKDLEKNCIK